MADEKKAVDWSEIERDFRTGTMSIREIARWYGVTDTAIRKKAKAGGWVRENADHSSQPKGAKEPRPEPEPKVYVGTVLTPENARPEAIVGRGRNLVLRMLDELEASTSRFGELEGLIESAYDTGDGDKAKQAALAAVSLKSRAEVLKALATAAKTLGETGAAGGKKEERQRAAEGVASGGRFAPRTPPKLVVSNG